MLYELYAFVVPVFNPRDRRLALPLLLMVPVLFLGGVVFCYFVVLGPALHFLLNFNASEFNTQLRASDYYGFATLTMVATGIGFQVPIGVLVITRLGSSAWTSCAAIAATRSSRSRCSPPSCPRSTRSPSSLEMVPLMALYELGILLARAFPAISAGPARSADALR